LAVKNTKKFKENVNLKNIASGIAATITTGQPTSNWRDETQG
jgi:hypothetical protein